MAEWGKLTDDEKKVYTANFKVDHAASLHLTMPMFLPFAGHFLSAQRAWCSVLQLETVKLSLQSLLSRTDPVQGCH